jgi:polar amino acid transport system permease protein
LNIIEVYLPTLLRGAAVTLEVTFLSIILAFLVAFIFGLGRLSKYAIVRGISYTIVEFIRGTSLMVQLFWLYFVLPFFGIELPSLAAGVLAIGLNYGAYGSEIVRSSILAVPKGQTEASIALNMTPWQRMRYVIIPQAMMRMIPPFGNLSIELLKGTSLVSFIALNDLTYEALTLRNYYLGDAFAFLTLLLIFYFVIAQLMMVFLRWLERKVTTGRV